MGAVGSHEERQRRKADERRWAKGGKPPGTRRLWASLSLLAWIALGLPVWWHLTKVYRSPEFFEAIKDFEGEAGLAEWDLELAADLEVVLVGPPAGWAPPGGEYEFAGMISRELAGVAARTPGTGQVNVTVRVQGGRPREWGLLGPGDLDEWLAGQLPASGGLAPASAHRPQYTLFVMPSDGGTETVLGKHRHGWVRAGEGDWAGGGRGLVPAVARAAARLAVDGNLGPPLASLPPGGAVLSFTLCVADPVATGRVTWDLEGAARAHLAPVVEALARAAGSVSVESQVIGFCRGRGDGAWSEEHGAHLLPHDGVPFFVDSEWNLDGTTAPPPPGGAVGVRGAAALRRRLHFVYYVPPPSLCPTRLLLASGRPSPTGAITMSAWGGLMVDAATCHPPSPGSGEGPPPPPRHIGAGELAPFLRVAVAQMRELVGLPGAPPVGGESGGSGDAPSPIEHVPSPAGFATWEGDALVRRQMGAHALEAARSLRSLGRLVIGMPGMAAGEEIVHLVRAAMAGGVDGRAAAAAGDAGAALAGAAAARLAAEAAFFHHTMLPALYFPSEHTLAIYVPLFFPTTVPVVFRAIGELKHWRRRRACAKAWRERG